MHLRKPRTTHINIDLKACIKSCCPLSVNTETSNAELHPSLMNTADWLQSDANGSPKKGKSFKPMPLEFDVKYDNSQNQCGRRIHNHYLSHNQCKGSDSAYGFFMHEYASRSHTLPDVPHKKGPKVK